METKPDFEGFGKIYRYSRPVIVTEKIDGTNAQIYIDDYGLVLAGSRNRWLTPEADNFGFAKWVEGNKQELLKLGPGRHFGEWWGAGIQRTYGLKEKRFSLFNVTRWGTHTEAPELLPGCCHVVPVLFRGQHDDCNLSEICSALKMTGSKAAPGFMKPEGVVLFHEPSKFLFKKTCEDDASHKGS